MEVRLRTDFYGAKIPKTSADSITVTVGFSYKGPAQTLQIETNTGKRGLLGDYDQESPAYYDSKPVSASDTLRSYTFSRSIPLSFWGSRQIDDGAVEVVISGSGVSADAVVWDAYTVNLGLKIDFKVSQLYAANVFPGASKWMCYYWDPSISGFVGDQKWYGLTSQIQFSNVKSGGYFAVFLLKDSTTSSQYTSPTFSAVNGGIYQYDLYYNTVSKIG